MTTSQTFQQNVYEPMYQPVTGTDTATPQAASNQLPATAVPSDVETGGVRRREGPNRPTKNLRQRLSNIVSWYVPNSSSGHEDGSLLLKIPGIQEEDDANAPETSQEDVASNKLFNVKKLFNIQQIADILEEGAELSLENASIIATAMVDRKLYMGFEGRSFLVAVDIDGLDELDISKVSHIPLRLQGREIFPKQIQFNQNVIYVSGYFLQQDANNQRMSILIKYTPSGAVIAQSRSYPFPRFGDISVDSEGSLLVASPQATEDNETARVFKLSPGFDRKHYYIRLGNQRAIYRPSRIAAHSAGNRGWVSVVLSPASTESPNVDETKVMRRLLSFPCCKPADLPAGTETKDWLKVESWNFESLAPGVVMNLGERLLVIDENDRNIHYISWNYEENQPSLRPISRPGTAQFVGMTSDGDDGYLFTSRDVFLFRFIK